VISLVEWLVKGASNLVRFYKLYYSSLSIFNYQIILYQQKMISHIRPSIKQGKEKRKEKKI
jgi:hypothetical protein